MNITKIYVKPIEKESENQRNEIMKGMIGYIDEAATEFMQIKPDFDKESFVIRVVPIAEKAAHDIVKAQLSLTKAVLDTLESILLEKVKQ